jgi:hypothetical protein
MRLLFNVMGMGGRAVGEACLPTAASLVRARSGYGIYGGQSDTGAGFLSLLRVSSPNIIPPNYPSS